MKQEFFKQMLTKLNIVSDVEILTDPLTRKLKGGGCTCKKSPNTFTCSDYNGQNYPCPGTYPKLSKLPK